MEDKIVSEKEASRMLEGEDVQPVVQAALDEAKRIVGACLDGGVPALLGRDDHCTEGCSPKVFVMARPEDAARIQDILRQRWAALLDSVEGGVSGVRVATAEELEDGGEPPCPACGTRAALVEGACPECGLQLE